MQPEPGSRFSIRAANVSDVAGMAGCHRRAFPDQFTSRMGQAYTEQFHRCYLGNGLSLIATVLPENACVGVAVGGRPDMLPRFRRRYLPRYILTFTWKYATDLAVRKAVRAAVEERLTGKLSPRQQRSSKGIDRSALLQMIAVSQEFRGTDVGAELISAFETECQRRGFSRVWLRVYRHNARAIAFYHKAGWSLAGETGPLVEMEKVLVLEPASELDYVTC